MFKKYGVYVAIGVLLVGVLIGFTRSCNLSNRLATVLTEYDTYKAITQADKQIMSDSIATFIEKTKGLNKEIDSKEKEVGRLTKEVGRVTKKSGQLERARERLVEQGAECEEVLIMAESQIESLKRQFSLAQEIIGKKDEHIFLLSEKYDVAVTIGNTYKAMHKKELDLRVLAEKKSNVLERKLRNGRFKGTVKTAIIGVALGIIVYQVVEK